MSGTTFIRVLPQLDAQYAHELDVMLAHDVPHHTIDRFIQCHRRMAEAIEELETELQPLEARAQALWRRYNINDL